MLEFSEYIQSPLGADIIHSELEKNFLFYKNLNPSLKQRFVQRTAFYIREKKFVPRQGLVMTPKIRIIVSACAVQVTFGLNSYSLDNFEYIVLYPDIYESPMTKKMHKGETNLNGFICLSWRHIIEGIENPNDNYNLGIHEWTHALRFNGINFQKTDYFFDGYINKWVASSMHEYNKLRAGKKSIFRRYGATNIHEFLSVCTEHFFESPDEFQKEAPDFFDEMCILLNQLPSKINSTKIDVRYHLLNKIPKTETNQIPILEIEASFLRTVLNLGVALVPFLFTLFVLLIFQSAVPNVLAGLLIIGAILKMDRMYFTVQFFEDYMYIQKGYFNSFASTLSINYRCLIKMEIYNAGVDGYSTATVFQLHYFDQNAFSTKIIYCSAIDIPHKEIKELLHKKKVAILWPS